MWWVADEGKGVATLFNGAGVKQSLVVTIPKSNPDDKTFPTGTPTGVIPNSSPSDFPATPNKAAAFIFATLDGSIAAWNPNVGNTPGVPGPSTNAVTVARGDAGSGYTALTTAFVDNNRYLYVANFLKGRIDVYDNAFNPVKTKDEDHDRGNSSSDEDIFGGNKPFTDERLPRNFVPFNVQATGNDLVVTYALLPATLELGTWAGLCRYLLVEGQTAAAAGAWRLAQCSMEMTLAPLDFGRFSHHLLVSNFSAGGTAVVEFISAYDLDTGNRQVRWTARG